MSIQFAPPPFEHGAKTIVPVTFQHLHIRITADIATEAVASVATLNFLPLLDGYPMFDLVADPEEIRLDGRQISTSALPEVSPPDNEAHMRFLDVDLKADSEYVLELSYPLEANTIVFESGGVRIGFFLNDLVERGFLERYAPANFEFDQFIIAVTLTVTGATSSHRLFSNGRVKGQTDTSWDIEFPSYFTSSSLFLHLTNRSVSVQLGTYNGHEREIPVEIYSNDHDIAVQTMAKAMTLMAELESDFGPYAHKKLIIYAAESLEPPLAGMEYCGATMTTVGALGHEIAHSWFGRGVMPGKGSAGWIDEAIASWRDYGYPRASGPPERHPVNLAGYSLYRRNTTLDPDPYVLGSLLLSELDFLLGNSGGLKPVLGKLYRENRNSVIDTPFFLAFLETETGLELDDIFTRYVYGRRGDDPSRAIRDFQEEPCLPIDQLRRAWGEVDIQPGPRPFTPQELRNLV